MDRQGLNFRTGRKHHCRGSFPTLRTQHAEFYISDYVIPSDEAGILKLLSVLWTVESL
jgi:hypothetical protein